MSSEQIAADFKMLKMGRDIRSVLDETDYSVVVKNRARPPNPWRWEVYRAGRSSPIKQSAIFFQTTVAANKAGKSRAQAANG